MKRKLLLLLFTLTVVLVTGCDSGTSSGDNRITASEEKQFVWSGLNAWYFWQNRVPDLADSKIEDTGAFNTFLNSFSDERALFNHLLFRPEDQFSWFIDDFEEHQAARVGISKSFGFRYGLVRLNEGESTVFGYVQYVVPESPADEAGLKRGDIFSAVNGQQLTDSNFQSLLNSDTYNLRLAEIRRVQDRFALQDKDGTIQVASKVFQENPILISRMFDTGSEIVGYLVFNAFRFNFHKELNDRFETFRNNGVTELVLDLRYNGGGAIITSAILAAMISGQDESNTFADLIHNSKRSSRDQSFPFIDDVLVYDNNGNFVENAGKVAKLNLNRLYVLTSRSTASASETLINAMLPLGIDVVIIGEQTAGKDEGSITVYDVPDASTPFAPQGDQERAKINPNHKRAMQPIVFKIFNSAGQDYPNGFEPAIPRREINDVVDGLRPLGDPDETLLKAAIGQITNQFLPKAQADLAQHSFEMIFDSGTNIPFFDDQFLIPDDMRRSREHHAH